MRKKSPKAYNTLKENKISKYAGKPLNSSKEKAAKKFESTAMTILKQFGSSK